MAEQKKFLLRSQVRCHEIVVYLSKGFSWEPGSMLQEFEDADFLTSLLHTNYAARTITFTSYTLTFENSLSNPIFFDIPRDIPFFPSI